MRARALTLIVGILLLLSVVAYLLFQEYRQSLFSSPLARINVAIWGEHSYVISLGKTTRQHYIFLFPNSYEVMVPGGLKGYKIGALGKLSSLEKDTQLFAKAMGQGSGVFVHKYLFSSQTEIFEDDTWVESTNFSQMKKEIFAGILAPGDLNVFDRLFVYLSLQQAKPSQTTVVRVKGAVPELLLYDKVFRNEKKLVQLVFSQSERTAYFIADFLENTGIRVADISKNPKQSSQCVIIESSDQFSQTSRFLSSYFDCNLTRGDTGLYEVQWFLNDEVENRWKL